MSIVHLVECSGYDVTAGAAKTLYYSTGLGYTSGASDTPAHTYFDPRLEQPINIRRDMFAAGTTYGRSQTARGDMVLINEDGELDVLAHYSFDGRSVKLYRGEDTASFPDGFTMVWQGTMQDADLSRGRVRIRLRDNQELLDQFYQTTKYLGDNALPAGLEGVTDIEGKPKPVALGLVRNVSPVLVNTSRLIYQVHDGAVDSVDMVFDSGIPIISEGEFTQRTHPITTAIEAGVWSKNDSQFVAVGLAPTAANEVMTSPDGTTWTQRTIADGDGTWRGMAYDETDGLYVIVGGGSSTGEVYTSPDGITWTSRTSNFVGGGGSLTIWGVATNGQGKYVAVGSSGDVIISSDGTTWAQATDNLAGGFAANEVTYAAPYDKWFACDDDGDIHMSSDDGDTWTEVYAGSDALKSIIFARGILLAVGLNGIALTSSDGGTTWDTRSVPALSSQMWDIDYGLGVFMVSGSSGNYATSPDGINWRSYKTDSVVHNAVIFGDTTYGTWVLSNGSGGVWSSTGAGTDYTSEAELLDDSLAPAPGQFKAYPAGGYIRLGSSPAGQVTADVTVEATAAERTAAQLWTDVLTRAGKSVLTGNVQTVSDLTTWGVSGTPLVTGGVDDPAGGSDAYMVEDDSGTGEYIEQAITFTGVAAKTVDVIFRRRNATPDGFLFYVRDTTAGADRLVANGSWSVNGVPSFSVSTGSVLEVLPERFGYWRARFLTSGVLPGNTNMARIQPASGGNLAILDVYRFYAYDQATAVSDDWNVNDVVAADNDNATVCGHWAGLEDTTFSAVLSALAGSIGAWWGVDQHGVYRIGVLKDPQLVTNWFTFPRTLDNAAWTKTRTTVTADDKVAPNGLVEMDLLVEDSTAGATHVLTRNIDGPLPDNEPVTITFAAAGSTRTEIRASITGKDGTVNSGFIDLSDGSVGTLSGATVTVVSDRGVYRISVTADIATGATTPSFAIHLSSGSETISYNGDGASGVHLWDIKRQKGVSLKIEENGMVTPIERLPAGLPTYQHTVRYQKNNTVQASGLAGGVSDARRVLLANEYLETVATDTDVQTAYLLARDSQIDTLLDTAAGAATEASRLQALRGARRERFKLTVPLDGDTESLDLGDYVDIVHPRFQLAAGKEFVVMTVHPDANAGTIGLEVWG